MPKLSVIIPTYNEAGTVKQLIEKVNSVPIDKEIIIIDDGSTDDTKRVIREIKLPNLKIIYHSSNRGKGSAFLTGLSNASGEFVIIQDADLEYDPNDYLKLMDAANLNSGAMVLGARFKEGHKGLFIHRLGNRTLTWILNLIFASHLNDYATCYKLARLELFKSLNLRAKSFDLETEIVCKAIRRKTKIIDIPVNYYPRNYREGKKIRFKDALWAVYYMLKFRFIN